MPWCPHCADDKPSAASADQSIRSNEGKSRRRRRRRFTSCSACGRVLKDKPNPSLLNPSNPYSKDSTIVHDIAAGALNLTPSPDHDDASSSSAIIGDAYRLFVAALAEEEELFARKGRRAGTHVAAACLYAALRRHRMPHMLIDLSNYLGVTVYVLCAVFVALTRALRLNDEEDARRDQPFIDPSLFMHRISSRLLGRSDAVVAASALRILSYNRSASKGWMLGTQGQIPIKICGAALYIAAIAHSPGGQKRISKSDVVSVVRAEFESMKTGGEGLTMDEFVSRVADMGSSLPPNAQALVCRHKNSSRAHCCHGLCRGCCDLFVKISRGSAFYHAAKGQRTKHRQEDDDEEATSEGSSLLDDVDDREIDSYINTRKEKQCKTIIWDFMYQEYADDRAAAVAAAMAGADAVKRREAKKQRRAGDGGSKEDSAEATKGKLKEVRVSSRINYAALSQLEEMQRAKTGDGGVSGEQNGNKDESWDAEAAEKYDEAETDDKPAEDEAYDYFGDYDEGCCAGGYTGHCADADEEYAADDDFGF